MTYIPKPLNIPSSIVERPFMEPPQLPKWEVKAPPPDLKMPTGNAQIVPVEKPVEPLHLPSNGSRYEPEDNEPVTDWLPSSEALADPNLSKDSPWYAEPVRRAQEWNERVDEQLNPFHNFFRDVFKRPDKNPTSRSEGEIPEPQLSRDAPKPQHKMANEFNQDLGFEGEYECEIDITYGAEYAYYNYSEGRWNTWSGEFTTTVKAKVVNAHRLVTKPVLDGHSLFIEADVVTFEGYPTETNSASVPHIWNRFKQAEDFYIGGQYAPGWQLSYASFTINWRKTETSPSVNPWLRYYFDDETKEEEMPCEPCKAAMALRALQRTITVDSTTITPLPTGDLIVTQTPKTQRVFALAGTEQSIKEQFDLMAEIKKRTAHAFNQARRAKIMTRLLQIMNITDFFLNLHNAMMISADIGETFFDAIFFVIDNVPKLLDELPFAKDFIDIGEWAGFDSKTLVTTKLDEMAKQAFGVQQWADAKAKWAAFNQIVRSANTVLMNMKDLRDSQGDLTQMTASRIAKVNNALVKSGVLTEDGELMTETVNRRSAFLDKLEKIEESGVVNTAVFFQTMTAGALDVQETKKELKESREEFQKAITDGTKTLRDGASASKIASQGANTTKDDAKPTE